jgi:glycosyltransferase involved in cell wall biosynthesis
LHPIQFDEPFGLSVVESMACGTPVIAFDRGSMPELIDNGKSGFLVDNLDQAIEAVARINEIERAYCRRHVELRFSAGRMIKEYIQVYETILDSERL